MLGKLQVGNMPQEYKNILIIKPSALGDVVTALPAVNALKRRYPDAKITWLIRPEFARILDSAPAVDQILIFDRKLTGKWWRSPKAFKSLKNLFSELKNAHFDLVIDLQGLFRTAFFALITGCNKRFGMKTAREGAAFFYTDKIDLPTDSFHVVDHYLSIAAAAGASADNPDFAFSPPSSAIAAADNLLTDSNITDRYIIFVPGAAHEIKCWPAQNFAQLADNLNKEFGLPIVAVGTAGEKQIVENINSIANTNIIDLTGKTDLPALSAIMTKASLIVTNDTGPGNLAVAANAPMVMIFGPTNPIRLEPYKKADSVAAIDPHTRPPGIRSFDSKYRIDAVAVAHVYDLAAKHLRNNTDLPQQEPS